MHLAARVGQECLGASKFSVWLPGAGVGEGVWSLEGLWGWATPPGVVGRCFRDSRNASNRGNAP